MFLGNKGRKTKAWQGFLDCTPDVTIMSLVTPKPPKPLSQKRSSIYVKEVSFAHQPYCALESVSDRIRWLRMQRGLTQKEAAERIGVGRPTYGDYESGIIERFDPVVIRKIEIGTRARLVCFVSNRRFKAEHHVILVFFG